MRTSAAVAGEPQPHILHLGDHVQFTRFQLRTRQHLLKEISKIKVTMKKILIEDENFVSTFLETWNFRVHNAESAVIHFSRIPALPTSKMTVQITHRGCNKRQRLIAVRRSVSIKREFLAFICDRKRTLKPRSLSVEINMKILQFNL